MKVLIKSIVFCVITLSAYQLTVVAAPYSILLFLKLQNNASFNEPVYADIITDKDRKVVLPNPDFLYIVSGYDLRKGPLKITGLMPEDSYYSLGLYEFNTRNFYVRNDRETPRKQYEIILATLEQQSKLDNEPLEIVQAPSTFGAVLVRILVTDPSQIPNLKSIQKSFKIEPY